MEGYQLKKYYVSIDVVYTEEVYANSKEEAIKKVIYNCPYDNDASVDPCCEEIDEENY